MNNKLHLAPYTPANLSELISLWQTSYETAVGQAEGYTIEEQTDYFQSEILPRNQVRVALDGEQVIGFIAATEDAVAECFVHVDFQGRGIGTQLMDWAKAQSNGALTLRTPACNTLARRFYEAKGFVCTGEGDPIPWRPDEVIYYWQRSAKKIAGDA